MEPEPESVDLEKALMGLATEGWRFSRVIARMLTKMDAGESHRYASQLRYFQKKVEQAVQEAQLTWVNAEGQRFDAGLAATALNLDEFEPDDELVVDQMIEPIIMGPDGLKRGGTVVLRKMSQ